MLNAEKEKLIRRYIDAYNAKDVDAMLVCVCEDVVFRNIMGGVTNMEIFGIRSLQELAEKTKDLFRTREQTITAITHEDGKTRVDIHFEAEFGMDLPNGVKAGQKMAVDGYSEFEFNNGLISAISDCS